MSETKNPGEKKLSVSGKTLTLKPRTETGVVRQSFSHGRSKQVVVEKVKRRTVGGPGEAKLWDTATGQVQFQLGDIEATESKVCISGQVLRGLKKPSECPAFGKSCTPRTPLGATMVSSGGACAAYFHYGRSA